MFSGSFLLVCGITSLASVILSIPTTTNDLLNRLPPEVAEVLLGENLADDVLESVFNGEPSSTDKELNDPDNPGINLKPQTRTFGNLFNFSAIVANAPNDTAAITLVPLISVLANIFNKTFNG